MTREQTLRKPTPEEEAFAEFTALEIKAILSPENVARTKKHYGLDREPTENELAQCFIASGQAEEFRKNNGHLIGDAKRKQ